MDKTIRVGIISGIVASMVFVYFLDPIIRVFGEGVVYVSRYIVTGLFDSLYQKCALGVAKDPALSIYAFMVGAIVGFPAAMISIIFRRSKENKKDQKETKLDNKKWIILVPVVVLPIMLFYQFWTVLFQYEVVTSFDQHVRILTPYLDINKKELILSRFASMQKEDDYKAIYIELNEVADKNNITLPENLSYGLWLF